MQAPDTDQPGDWTGRRIVREAVRALLIDPAGEVLLLRGHDPQRPALAPWWFTPGGGIKEGETHKQALHRELVEELGIGVLPSGFLIGSGLDEFTFNGAHFVQSSTYYRIEVPRFRPSMSGLSRAEQEFILGWQWWSPTRLLSSGEVYYPEQLPHWATGAGIG